MRHLTTEEQRILTKALRASAKRKLSPEHKAKIAAGHRGKRHSHETRIKMSMTRRAMIMRRHKA